MKKNALFALCLSFSMLSTTSCSHEYIGADHSQTKDVWAKSDTTAAGEVPESGTAAAASQAASALPGQMNTSFQPGFNNSADPYKPLQFQVNAPQYQISQDLSNITNIGQFSNLTQKQRDMIAKNGFVVTPTGSEQLFYIYEDNAYKKVPSFVTTDSVLQLYHILYDYSLRSLETGYFYDDMIHINDSMLTQLAGEYQIADHQDVRNCVYQMMGYFGVSSLALGKALPADYPAELKAPVNEEYDLITKAEGKATSPLFGYTLDYSLFKVRGHYTRSEELGRYFRAMSWYGTVPMPFYTVTGERDEISAIRAIVTTLALCTAPENEGVKPWENIYSTTSFFVGESDDLTPYEVAQAVKAVYSDTPDINQIPDKLDAFYTEIETMRKPDIVLKTATDNKGLQLRFMGQRYIPDSEILQKLSDPDDRPFPTGMDLFAVYGSERAEELLDEIYKPDDMWKGYRENFDLLKDKFRGQSIAAQTANLYTGWLYCLKSLTGRPDKGYPLFMTNNAWEDKSLSTALGSWAEIRHDTILYGKQSAAECGGDEPPDIVGYVEPNPEFFNRLLWLTADTRVNLASRGFLSDDMKDKMENFEDMLEFLKTCAQKELSGEDLSPEEHSTLFTFGGTLESLSSSIADSDNWYLIESDTDKNMACIADVHTSSGHYLEEGVGTAAEMYVAIPQNGQIYLARGAVFDYYEFVGDTRLTDEAWQAQIKTAPPARPQFTGSYMDQEQGAEIETPAEPYSSGC